MAKLERLTVRAARLRPGDRLVGSQRVVVALRRDPYCARKVHVYLAGELGYYRTWGASTTLTIDRSQT